MPKIDVQQIANTLDDHMTMLHSGLYCCSFIKFTLHLEISQKTQTLMRIWKEIKGRSGKMPETSQFSIDDDDRYCGSLLLYIFLVSVLFEFAVASLSLFLDVSLFCEWFCAMHVSYKFWSVNRLGQVFFKSFSLRLSVSFYFVINSQFEKQKCCNFI